jgi:hypothetical protein
MMYHCIRSSNILRLVIANSTDETMGSNDAVHCCKIRKIIFYDGNDLTTAGQGQTWKEKIEQLYNSKVEGRTELLLLKYIVGSCKVNLITYLLYL